MHIPAIIHSRRGQTLVEALMALSLLTVGFLGIITLLTKSFQLNRTTIDDAQATYLAAEGIEITKSIIDYDVYYGLPGNVDWGCSFEIPLNTPTDYELDYNVVPLACNGLNPPLTSVPAATAQSDPLYFNPSTTFYSYNGFAPAVKSIFTRDIRVTAVSANEFDVQSIVTWSGDGTSNTITLEDQFYNWHP